MAQEKIGTFSYKLRRLYGVLFLILLVFQVIITNAVFLLIGFGLMELDDTTLQLYVGSTIAQISAWYYVLLSRFFEQRSSV
ncbi:hypothetical protein ACLHXW_05950 [Escherichia coli]|uniref:hypothetical protein n=1 Tax=Escherichia coli TaxID=562 RepID=UPI0039A6684F